MAEKNATSIVFLKFVYELYQTMRDHNIILFYEGEVTHDLTKAFTALTESTMTKKDEPGVVQKKVFHVMVECLQNIIKHADETNIDSPLAKKGIFLISRNENEYAITTGNIIDIHKQNILKEMLDNLNKMNKETLDELYKKQIKEGVISNKGGAGLGFIDIVRKTGNKLNYYFLPIDPTTSFFLLTSKINRS